LVRRRSLPRTYHSVKYEPLRSVYIYKECPQSPNASVIHKRRAAQSFEPEAIVSGTTNPKGIFK